MDHSNYIYDAKVTCRSSNEDSYSTYTVTQEHFRCFLFQPNAALLPNRAPTPTHISAIVNGVLPANDFAGKSFAEEARSPDSFNKTLLWISTSHSNQRFQLIASPSFLCISGLYVGKVKKWLVLLNPVEYPIDELVTLKHISKSAQRNILSRLSVSWSSDYGSSF
ncbi:hypothetical protein Q3G72_020420 [Acer saccharum]|nr:hypothetical protein Q3G72_020420 [Acer saccharum]